VGAHTASPLIHPTGPMKLRRAATSAAVPSAADTGQDHARARGVVIVSGPVRRNCTFCLDPSVTRSERPTKAQKEPEIVVRGAAVPAATGWPGQPAYLCDAVSAGTVPMSMLIDADFTTAPVSSKTTAPAASRAARDAW
jgi:hypothetical protein